MRSLLPAALLLSLSAPNAMAQTDTGWTPTLMVRGLPSRAEGMRAEVSGDRKLLKGEPDEPVTIWTGRTFCTLGISSADPMPGSGAPGNVWRMTSEYLGDQGGRYQVRVTSGFTLLAGRDTSATTTQTFSLREGDEVVLDALTGPPETNCEVHAITIEAKLVMKPNDPAVARTRYLADLWLVHTAPDGQEQRQHAIMNLDGSGPAPFMFNRLAFAVPRVDARQGDIEAVIRLKGALRLRPRGDGNVDVDLDTNAMLFNLERPDSAVSDFSFAAARKTVTVKENETTAIEFPAKGMASLSLLPPGGSGRGTVGAAGGLGSGRTTPNVTRPPLSSDARQAVESRNNRLYVQLGPFFKNHKTQLLLTLRRVD